ncbi:MAG: hypothetical protein ACRCTZ_17565 [Sarcina sp.]
MSLQRKSTNMGILDLIPTPFLRLMVSFASILFCLNTITLILNLFYKANLPMASISFVISSILLGCAGYLLRRNGRKEMEKNK